MDNLLNLFAKLLLVTGPKHARLLVGNTPNTVSGKLEITAAEVRFQEYSDLGRMMDWFSPSQGSPKSANAFEEFFPFDNNGNGSLFGVKPSPLISFAHRISDIASVGVEMVSSGEYRRAHPEYTPGSSAGLFEQPRACVSITLKSGEQVMICPLPKTDRIVQEVYARYLVSLIQNTRAEEKPNTDIPCKCCGKVLSTSKNFCECCGMPIHVVRRISARDGVERKIKVSLKRGDRAEITTDSGNKLSFSPRLADPRVLKVLSPRMALCVVTPHDAKRFEIRADGDGELQFFMDKASGRIESVKCRGKVSVLREDAADPAFLYYGDMALKPAAPYGAHDNLVLLDP